MKETLKLFTFVLIVLTTVSHQTHAMENIRDGQVNKNKSEAFDAQTKQWLSLSDFWRSYANRTGGLTYGVTKEYPPYNQTKEHDTLIIVTNKGECMMEFFHRRWRRANDVRRWDPAFNDFSGCPYVFD